MARKLNGIGRCRLAALLALLAALPGGAAAGQAAREGTGRPDSLTVLPEPGPVAAGPPGFSDWWLGATGLSSFAE